MNIPDDTGTGTGSEVRCQITNIDILLPDVKHWLPSCNVEITMRKTLATVVQNFCRQTGIFLTTTADITVVDDQESYAIPMIYEADMLNIEKIEQYALDSDGAKERDPLEIFRNDYTVTDDLEDDSQYIKLLHPLASSTDSQSVLKITMSLIPRYDEMIGGDGCSLPNKLMQRWRQAFVSGAIHQLASMTNKAWSNRVLAENNFLTFDSMCNEAIDKARGARQITGKASMQNDVQWV